MANLAIKGHTTRGEEVIGILGILGGSNAFGHIGNNPRAIYYIDENNINFITCSGERKDCDYIIFTLEEFLEKFPYKVGDKVIVTERGIVVEIISMSWRNGREIIYETIHKGDCCECFSAEELQPYKEETMKDYLVTEEDYVKTLEVEQEYIDAAEKLINQLAESTHWKCKDFDSQKMIALFLKKNTNMITEKEDSIIVDIPKGYEFAGVDDNAQQVVFTKIQPEYPKTYEECCKVVNASPYVELVYNVSDGQKYSYDIDNLQIYENIRRLKICRNAYWKIAGEEMGLGKPWEPDWKECSQPYHCIIIEIDNFKHLSHILVFPTAEMRDAFYENFKDLIEQCKELL